MSKEKVKVEKVNKKEKKEETKKDWKMNYKLIAILYLLCAFCWLVSGVLNVIYDGEQILYILDFALTAVWLYLALVYIRKDKENPKK